ncbi:MAG: M81 family metallopeptidase [Propionicimonas sp.]
MGRRVGIARVYHESNTFIQRRTTLDDYRRTRLLTGTDLFAVRGADSEIAGFLDAADEFGFEPIPLLDAWAWPSGQLTQECFEALEALLAERIASVPALDGLLLALHGAMAVDGVDVADERLARTVRRSLGVGILIATFDLHANLPAGIADPVDGLVGYHTYPHVDLRETGRRAGVLMARTLSGGPRPVTAVVPVPVVPHQLGTVTAESPMRDLVELAEQLCAGTVFDATVAAGFAYADVPQLGMAAVAVAADRTAAQDAASRLAERVWQARGDFLRPVWPVAAATELAVTSPGLTVLADVGDNIGGGTPGDGVEVLDAVLRAAHRHQTDPVMVAVIADPVSVAECVRAGVGSTAELQVGGRSDPLYPGSLAVTGRVRGISDGRFRNVGPMRDGLLDDQGTTAVVESGGLSLVLTERPLPPWNLQQLRSVGVEPAQASVIIVKATLAFRAAYEPIADRILAVDSAGASCATFVRLGHRRRRRPLYPFEDETFASWNPTP